MKGESKGSKHTNRTRNQDLQDTYSEYDPIKHFMEIQ